MSRGISLEQIVDTTYERLHGRIPKNEIRRSMAMIAGRWYSVVSLGEKWNIAETIGGARYVGTTYEILDALFSGILDVDIEEDN